MSETAQRTCRCSLRRLDGSVLLRENRLKEESARRGIETDRMTRQDVWWIENWYNSSVSLGKLTSPAEQNAIKERFRRLVGREIQPPEKPPEEIERNPR